MTSQKCVYLPDNPVWQNLFFVGVAVFLLLAALIGLICYFLQVKTYHHPAALVVPSAEWLLTPEKVVCFPVLWEADDVATESSDTASFTRYGLRLRGSPQLSHQLLHQLLHPPLCSWKGV
ncbi:hypothetical protein UPYG_G00130580 [Umbra pygmaea]|uniref:Uncharacterized protein n=1 Tax=Umbra pygmaea TaxID=75934 RepID=A0ABD0X6Z3_UMBPY